MGLKKNSFFLRNNLWISESIVFEVNVFVYITPGISLEAYDDIIEWVIVKGVTSYFNQTQSPTSEWMSFASTMAASIVASTLKDPAVFLKWPHYNEGKSHH